MGLGAAVDGQDQRIALALLFIERTNEDPLELEPIAGLVPNDLLLREAHLLEPGIAVGLALGLPLAHGPVEGLAGMGRAITDRDNGMGRGGGSDRQALPDLRAGLQQCLPVLAIAAHLGDLRHRADIADVDDP